jgi:hypothetical protein
MEIGCGDGALGYQVFSSHVESMVGNCMEMISFYTLLLLHRKPEFLPRLFSYPLEVGPLRVAYSW